jgi:hypothetical protein
MFDFIFCCRINEPAYIRTTMSFVDFSQQAEDHTRILILILPVGSIPKPKNFSKVYERISRLQSLTVPTNPPRLVRVRYRKYYAIENNAWGDFQVHRRVLGLLTVGHCDREDDLAEVYRQHEQQKVCSLICVY